ncbi:MAG TPA: IclR family transcriptional regulator [Steroidobacter sp.]|jgi:DNA-binding IclR family transcriptional regulator
MANISAFGQGIRRIALLLQTLGRGSPLGMRLTDIAAQTRLNKATVHRLLAGLNQVGLIEQDELTGRFHLGFEMFALGSSVISRYGLRELAHPHLVRIESLCNDTTYLSVRSGFEAVCIDRYEGSYPVKVLTLNVGDHRPLGIGAGSLALLAFMPDAEIDKALEANRERLKAYPAVDVPKLYALIEATRRQGYAFFDGLVVEEMAALGLPIMGRNGQALAAIGVAAVRSRMQRERREQLLGYMKEEAAALQAKLETLTSRLSDTGVETLKQLSLPAATTRPADSASGLAAATPVRQVARRRAKA